MKKKWGLVIVCISIITLVFSQPKTIIVKDGKWIFQLYASNIIKATYQPKGYLTNEAVIVATESRTSSPVRIPRDKETLNHPQLKNFYPCGEGAGYSGGIVSAAMDGERIANQLADVMIS